MASIENPAPSDSDLAAKLLRGAGALAQSIRAEGLAGLRAGSHVKGGVSDFATAADLAAERYLFAELRAARPDDSILGEEGASHEGGSGRCWVVDPVDGTYNFTSGSSYWCTALALVLTPAKGSATAGRASADRPAKAEVLSASEVHLGAVYQRDEDKLWLGGTSQAATLNGEPISVSPDVGLDQLSAATYIHPGWLADPAAAVPWKGAAERPATLRMLGSGSCDLGRVAQGELGVWFQHSAPSWDWLPGKGIVEAAGGDTDVVRVNGLDWFLAGPRRAVAELREALELGALP